MNLKDRYGNELTTGSQQAADAYIRGVDLFLEAQAGADLAFEEAIAADPNFAVAYADYARALQMLNRMDEARPAISKAVALSGSQSAREQGHISILHNLLSGKGGDAYAGILSHMKDHPRDAMAMQPCAGVFGLIGFSGRHGREAEQLAFQKQLQPHYGNDWWYGVQLAFAQVEAGQLSEAQATIAPAYAANRNNANGAHINAHIQYECGESKQGYRDVVAWRQSYDPGAPLHCHLSWHEAIWALEAGDIDHAWCVMDNDVRPNVKWGPPINVLTDTAAFLLRAEIAGEKRPDNRWREVSEYAATMFANPGISFADFHSVIAHAMAGNSDALQVFIASPAGPAGDVVKALVDVYQAFVKEDWLEVIRLLLPILSQHERLGGSRAQRDLIEFTYLNALLRAGLTDEARRQFATRRPHKQDAQLVAGLAHGPG